MSMIKPRVGNIIHEAVEASTREICKKKDLSKEEEEVIRKLVNNLITLAYEGRPTDIRAIDEFIEEAANVHYVDSPEEF